MDEVSSYRSFLNEAATSLLNPVKAGSLMQGKAVEYQTEQVIAFQTKFERGEVSKNQLDKQQSLLGKMTVRFSITFACM